MAESRAMTETTYGITWENRSPDQLRKGDYFKAVDSEKRPFEGVVNTTPWILRDHAPGTWYIMYSPTPGLVTSGTTCEQTVKVALVRKI